MKYQFNLNVTEKDYIDFNTFWMFRAPYGKKQILTCRIVIAAILAVFALVSLFGGEFSKEAFIGIIPTLFYGSSLAYLCSKYYPKRQF